MGKEEETTEEWALATLGSSLVRYDPDSVVYKKKKIIIITFMT